MKYIQAVTMILLAALLAELIYTVHVTRPHLLTTVENADRTIIVAGAAAGNLERSARAWEAASKAQAAESTAVLTQTNTSLKQLQITLVQVHTLASNMDVSLSTLLNHSTQAIDQQNQSLLETQAQLRENLLQMQQTTTQLQAVLVDADKVMADPNIVISLAAIADSTRQMDASVTDVRIVADKFRDDYTKPVNRAWAVTKALVGLGGQAGAISLLKK